MLWVKAFHIIFLVTWFAGLFYLPRLFVYHADCADAVSNERFKIMERRLFAIMTIGAILTAIFGFWMLAVYAGPMLTNTVWLPAKMILVVLLVAYHLYCLKLVREFRADRNQHDHRWYRWFNEFPTILLITIILLAVVKPF